MHLTRNTLSIFAKLCILQVLDPFMYTIFMTIHSYYCKYVSLLPVLVKQLCCCHLNVEY